MSALTKFVTEEWYFFVPMLLLSLVSAALVVWRILLNMNARTNMSLFLPEFQAKLETEGVNGALLFCQEQPGLIPQKLYTAGLESSKQGLAAMKRAMASAMELEIVPQLNLLLPLILAIAKIATMVGLLLTVFSMINTFNAISDANKGSNPQNVTNQSSAIGLALFGTAGGLMIAIPLVFAHVLFKARVARFEIELKSAAQKLLLLFQNLKPKQGNPLPLAGDSPKPTSRPSATLKREPA
jgi:biopolymer transport protein ExbB